MDDSLTGRFLKSRDGTGQGFAGFFGILAFHGLQNLLGISDSAAERILQELEDEGKIKQTGEVGAGVFYKKL